MVLKILFAVCVIIEIIFTPLYLKAFWPRPNKKSLCLKMVCSTAFVCTGILSMYIADNFTPFAITMVIGLILGWIGDYFLHAKSTMTYFLIGGGSFMMGHLAYIIAFIRAIPIFNAEMGYVTVPEIVAFVIIFIIFGTIMIKKFHFETAFLKSVTFLYGIFLVTMLIKSVTLGITYFNAGNANGILVLIWLVLAGLMFFMSDFSLGVMLLGGHNENRRLKVFNIVTYFGAQMLLASSILFIHA